MFRFLLLSTNRRFNGSEGNLNEPVPSFTDRFFFHGCNPNVYVSEITWNSSLISIRSNSSIKGIVNLRISITVLLISQYRSSTLATRVKNVGLTRRFHCLSLPNFIAERSLILTVKQWRCLRKQNMQSGCGRGRYGPR